MSLVLFPVSSSYTPGRRPGRPRVASDPAEQAKHIAVAKARLLYDAQVKKLARMESVSTRTIIRWTQLALRYDGPEAEKLRRLAQKDVANN